MAPVSVVLLAAGLACGAPSGRPPAENGGAAAQPSGDGAPTSGAAASASAPAPRPIRIVLATISAAVGPVVVAHEAGFLAREGLESELLVARSGAEAMAALLSGDVPVGAIGGTAVINANAGGADLVAVATHQRRFTFQVMAGPELRAPADLRGKRLGIADVGGASDLATQYFLNKFGLRRGEDVAVLALGGQAERLGGLQAGAVHAAMLQAPFTGAARKAGYPALFDFSEEDYEVPINGIATQRAYTQTQPDILRRVLKAEVDAIHYYKTERQGTADIIGRFLNLDDRETLEDIYRESAGPALPEAPYPTRISMVNALSEVVPRNEAAARLRPEDLIEDRFVRELDESGYIRALYQAEPAR